MKYTLKRTIASGSEGDIIELNYVADRGTSNARHYHFAPLHILDNPTYSLGESIVYKPHISKYTANYGSTLDSGIEVAGTYTVSARDCKGPRTGNCNVVDWNFVTFSGGFGNISVGERFDAGAAMLSRLTASGPVELDLAIPSKFLMFWLSPIVMELLVFTV